MGVLNAAAKAPGSSTATRLTNVAKAAYPTQPEAYRDAQRATRTHWYDREGRQARRDFAHAAVASAASDPPHFTMNRASRTWKPAEGSVPGQMWALLHENMPLVIGLFRKDLAAARHRLGGWSSRLGHGKGQ